jgi:hypothetical protein
MHWIALNPSRLQTLEPNALLDELAGVSASETLAG